MNQSESLTFITFWLWFLPITTPYNISCALYAVIPYLCKILQQHWYIRGAETASVQQQSEGHRSEAEPRFPQWTGLSPVPYPPASCSAATRSVPCHVCVCIMWSTHHVIITSSCLLIATLAQNYNYMYVMYNNYLEVEQKCDLLCWMCGCSKWCANYYFHLVFSVYDSLHVGKTVLSLSCDSVPHYKVVLIILWKCIVYIFMFVEYGFGIILVI